MDREQARFILRSLRSDGADSGNPDFEEALAVASADEELGAWLAAEQMQDASMAAALGTLAIPKALRNRILAALQAEEDSGTSGERIVEEEQVPSGSQSLETLPKKPEMTVLKVEIAGQAGLPVAAGQGPGRESPRDGERWVQTALAAIFLVVGAFVAFELTASSSRPGKEWGDSVLRDLEDGVIAEVTRADSFSLEIGGLREHESWLRENMVPESVAAGASPGIPGERLVGSRFFEIAGSRASHFCFDVKGEPIHLITLRAESFREGLSGKAGPGCRQCLNTGMSVASWQGKNGIFLLVGKLPEEELLELLKPDVAE